MRAGFGDPRRRPPFCARPPALRRDGAWERSGGARGRGGHSRTGAAAAIARGFVGQGTLGGRALRTRVEGGGSPCPTCSVESPKQAPGLAGMARGQLGALRGVELAPLSASGQ